MKPTHNNLHKLENKHFSKKKEKKKKKKKIKKSDGGLCFALMPALRKFRDEVSTKVMEEDLNNSLIIMMIIIKNTLG